MSDKMGIPARTYGALEVQLRESLITRALVLPIQEFIHIQGMSSILLLGAAVAALVWANSPWHDSYHHVWELQLTLSRIKLPVHAWINDALMAIFFFLVGMEIKHEIVHGELSDIRKAALPIVGALGGMVLPALVVRGPELRRPRTTWLGRPHGHRHCLLPGRAGHGERHPVGAESLPADPGHCRRHRRYHRHRILLHRHAACSGAVRWHFLPAHHVRLAPHRHFADHRICGARDRGSGSRSCSRASTPPSPE